MDDLKRVIIDNHELGERLGLKEEDVIRDGKVIMRDQVWTKEALTKAVAECRQRAAGADIVENRGHCASWALAAMAYAVLPAVCYFEIGPGGMYKLTSTPFPVNAAGNDAADVLYLDTLVKYAMIIISTVPILCIYPFVQKYFMKGVMMGSIKE